MIRRIFISYCAAIQTDHSHENKISDVAYGMRKRVVDLIRNLEFIFEDSAKHNFEMHWKESPRPAHSLLNPFTEAWELGNSRSCLNLDLKDDDNPFTEAWEQLDYRPYLNLEDELYNYEELELFHAIDQHIYDVFIKSYLTNEEINKVCEKCKEQYIIATDYRNIASKYNLEFHFNPEKLVEKLVEHEIVEPETKEFQCSDYLMNSDLLTTTRGDQIEIENIKDFQLLVNFLKTLEIYENWMSQIRFDCVDSQRNPPLCNA